MAENDLVTLGKIHYYMREKLYGCAQTEALEGLRKYGNDSLLKFYVGVCKVLEGRVQEGISDLELLKGKRDVNICSLLALSHAHRLCKTVDRQAIQDLDGQIKADRKQAGEMGLLYAGRFLMIVEKHEKAKEYLDRACKLGRENKQAATARGWLDLHLPQAGAAEKAAEQFERAEGDLDPDLFFGRAKLFELKKNIRSSLDMVNQAIVNFSNFVPAFIEKMKLQMALQDWDQVLDTVNRALIIDSNCIEAKKYMILHKLVRECSYEEASQEIGDLIMTLDRVEGRNATLYSDISATFARVCGKNTLILQQCYDIIERAIGIEKCAPHLNELGYQQYLKENYRRSYQTYVKAFKLDSIEDDFKKADCFSVFDDGDIVSSSNTYSKASKQQDAGVDSMCGLIRAQLLQGNVEEARGSLEFLTELNSTVGSTAEVIYLSAIMDRKNGTAAERVIEKYTEAITTHFRSVKGVPVSALHFKLLNPELVMRMIADLLQYAPQAPISSTGPPNKVLKIASSCLESVIRSCPALLDASYLLGKVKYLSGDTSGAQKALNNCLEQDSTFSDAHILMAQIHSSQNNFKLANQSLEVGLSYNFEVRDHPLYHLIKARILVKQGDMAEAKKTLQTAIALPGVKTTGKKTRKRATEISINDRVSVFIELADAHLALGEQPEAAKVMQDAVQEFEGTAEEVRINISNADLAINRGDIDGALTMLRNIGPDQAYFVEAREKMAQIYLNHRKDPRLYAGCYRELAEKNPTTQTQLLLGDAYMAIQETAKAIEVYEQALKKNPRDGQIARKIGEALVKTHNYNKAVTYYEHSLKGGAPQKLKLDLANLLIKLKRYEKCEKVLKLALEAQLDQNDFEEMQDHTKYWLLLSKVQRETGRQDESVESLNLAKDLQVRVITRAQLEAPDTLEDQKKLSASICAEMAQHYADARDYEKAIRLRKEAANNDDGNGEHALKLANLMLLTEDLDGCQHQLVQLLKTDKVNEKATVMMADLMFRKNEHEQAMYHFQQLLDKKPEAGRDHWHALSRLVDLMRRAGRLDECAEFIKNAENANANAQMQAGFNYCKALHLWYTGDPNGAVSHFNMARKDSEFGQSAVYNLIEICLNPDNNTIGGEVFDSLSNEKSEREDLERSALALRTAEKLLNDIKKSDIRAQLLENMLLVQTKSKSNVESALQAFTDIATENREHVGALYGMAAAYMVLKQTPRARTQLKRLSKSPWNMEDAEDLEKSWLLLADIYIQSNKYDLAQEMIERVLNYNKSCCKAYEYRGFIMEKEQSFKHAAENYEKAWKYGNKNNPQIGYKLGFNYIKSKRYVEAIDIASHVLKQHPNYPKIRKDVLEKARINIRT